MRGGRDDGCRQAKALRDTKRGGGERLRVRGEEKAEKDVKSHLGPGSRRLFQLQRLRLIEQLASPTESGTGAAPR